MERLLQHTVLTTALPPGQCDRHSIKVCPALFSNISCCNPGPKLAQPSMKRKSTSSPAKGPTVSAPNKKPAFLARNFSTARKLTYSDCIRGPVLGDAEEDLYRRLHHAFTRGHKTDWTGMTYAWNERALEFAVNNKGHHKFKMKTEKLLKSYEYEHIRQALKERAETYKNLAGKQAFSGVPSGVVFKEGVSEVQAAVHLKQGSGLGGKDGQRKCALCDKATRLFTPQTGHCCRCFRMANGLKDLVTDTCIKGCRAKQKRRAKGLRDCDRRYFHLLTVEDHKAFK
jgi:hypothetical protein